MDIIYSEETLFVNIESVINDTLVSKMQNRVFKIIDEYDIDNIVINVLSSKDYDTSIFDNFINNYNLKYGGKLNIN